MPQTSNALRHTSSLASGSPAAATLEAPQVPRVHHPVTNGGEAGEHRTRYSRFGRRVNRDGVGVRHNGMEEHVSYRHDRLEDTACELYNPEFAADALWEHARVAADVFTTSRPTSPVHGLLPSVPSTLWKRLKVRTGACERRRP